jgi:uncharacterized protein YqfA (UPF0365 family)
VVTQIEKLKADLVAAQTTAEISRNQALATEMEVISKCYGFFATFFIELLY